MYLYIHDNIFSKQSGLESTLRKIESRLVDLGMTGQTEKMTPLKSVSDVLKSAFRNQIENVVVIGRDDLFLQVASMVAQFDKKTIGFIPVDDNSRVAKLLGMPAKEKACDVLSLRITRLIDLGKVNNHYFLTSISTKDKDSKVYCDNLFAVSTREDDCEIHLVNSGAIFAEKNLDENCMESVSDGLLRVIVKKNHKKEGLSWLRKSVKINRKTNIPFKGCYIESDSKKSQWMIDNIHVIHPPFQVEAIPKKLKVIVGKKRMMKD